MKFIRLAVLSIFLFIISYLMYTKRMYRFVSPRFKMFFYISILILIIMIIFSLIQLSKDDLYKKKLKKYFLCFIPLIFIFTLKDDPTSDPIVKKQAQNMSYNINSSIEKKEVSEEKEFINENINVTTSNFISFLKDIDNNPSKYSNKNITIDGFIYKTNDMKPNEFAIARNMMVCCAADMEIVGITCNSEDAGNYESSTWVKVTGKVNEEELNNNKLILEVASITKEDMPEENIVYP